MTAEPLLKLAARLLAKHRLDAVLIGNAAAALNGAPVTTMDLDFYMRPTPANIRKVRSIASDMKAAISQPFYPASHLFRIFRDEDGAQFDFMVAIAGIRSFEGLRARSSIAKFGGNPIRVASLEDIIRSKAAANRPQDRAVMHVLRSTVKERQRIYKAARRRNA